MNRLLISTATIWPAAAALCLSIVWDMGYEIDSAESILALGIASIFSLLTLAISKNHSRPINVIAILLLTTVIDIFFVSDRLAYEFLAVGTGIAFAFRRADARWFICVFSVLILTGIALQNNQDIYRPERANKIQPRDRTEFSTKSIGPIVHIVMDEMGSFSSTPLSLRPQSDIESLKTAYLKRGFVVYDHARSNSAETQISLSTLLETTPQSKPGTNIHRLQNGFQHTIKHNGIYAFLMEQGWNVKIFQSDFLDVCSESGFECNTYSRGDHNHVFSHSNLTLRERYRILGFETHRQLTSTDRGAAIYTLGTRASEFFLHRSPPIKSSYSSRPPAMVKLLDDAVARLTMQSDNNDAIFIHALLPHFPWVLDRNCDIQPIDNWQVANWVDKGSRTVAMVFNAHWEQTLCAHHKILWLIDKFDEKHTSGSIIIHGDHGPRILARRLTPHQLATASEQTKENVLGGFLAIRTSVAIPIGDREVDLQEIVRNTLLQAGRRTPHESATP